MVLKQYNNQDYKGREEMNGMNNQKNVIMTIMSGAEDGKKKEFEKMPVTVGKANDNDLCLPYDNRISKYHIEITKEGNDYWLEDLKSTNGTYLDDMKVKERIKITSGNIFAIGTIWLKFEEKD